MKRYLEPLFTINRSDRSPPGGAEASEINIRGSARFETGSSTRLQRASEPPWLQRQIDFPIVSGRPGIRCRMPRRYIGCCPSDYEQVYEFLDRRFPMLGSFAHPGMACEARGRGGAPDSYLLPRGAATSGGGRIF